MFKNIIASAKRTLTKKKTLNSILNKDQFNKGVVNIHRIDLNNVGDYYCAPHHYFKELKGSELDIFDYKSQDKKVTDNFIQKISANSLIIGGGGLLNRSGFKHQMRMFEKLASRNKNIVLWGVGHNDKHLINNEKIGSYNIDIQKFGLVGTRDLSMPGEYVPCVSCLHSIFDNPFKETQEFGIVFHKDTLKRPDILKRFSEYPSSSNTTQLEELIQFIGSSKKIITDSYHVMYWSMLLDKQVAVIPNSSKFFDFKYKPLFTDFENALNSFSRRNDYSEVLEECRELNLKFSEKVFNYLNI